MSVVKAVFKRNLIGFFGNPAGYVFIILFVLLTAWFAFVTEEFFANNLANLNPLTYRMPWLLMIFVASVTMSTWAEEKKLGTDELLFTLPSGDMEVVVGKFLAALAVFTASLGFTLSHVLILCHLGDPDIGLILATYLGYWLMGAAFIATGMFASSLTNNITVGFILGAVFCAVFAFAHVLALIFPGRLGSGINEFAAVTHMESFARGVVSLKDVVYFAGIAAVMLYFNSIVLGSRRWPGGSLPAQANPKLHTAVRIAAVIVIAVSANVLVGRVGGRMDITEEGLSSLSDETELILADLSPENPVFIQAWISRDVPPPFVETRDTLLGMLKEYDERGGNAVQVRIYRPEPFSQEAREAEDTFGIYPQAVRMAEGGESATAEIFAGAAFACGAEEEVISFFHPGIPIEYELTRTIRVVSNAKRPKVGVIDNELKLFGGFDFETYSQAKKWDIVYELEKQYEVSTLRADTEIPEDVDVIIAALPSLLNDEKLDNLIEAIRGGKPALILVDPLPLYNLMLSPKLPRPNPKQNPMMAGRQPPGEPKCDIDKLMNLLGVGWPKNLIVWDKTNPHPDLRHLSPEFVFVTESPRTDAGFNSQDPVSSGLQEVLALFPGTLRQRAMGTEGELFFAPLIATSTGSSGVINWDKVVTQTFFGPRLEPLEALSRMPRRASPTNYVLAARIWGEIAAGEAESEEGAEQPADASGGPGKNKIDVILVADLDMFSDQFFQIRMAKWLNFDNVTFILNSVDALAGDESYISLRKKRRKFRTLTRIEGLEEQYRETKQDEEADAESDALQKLAEAQASFDEQVKAVEEREDLDLRAKEVMIASVRTVEERKLAAKKERIEVEKEKRIEASHFAMRQEIQKIHSSKKVMAMVLPVIPPLLIGLLVYFIRRARENLGEARSRLLRD